MTESFFDMLMKKGASAGKAGNRLKIPYTYIYIYYAWRLAWFSLMKKGASAGMKMFEQDFICQTQEWTALNLTLGRDWCALSNN